MEFSAGAVPRAAIGGVTSQAAAGAKHDPHEETQVRITAQRILAAHLRYRSPERRPHHSGDRHRAWVVRTVPNPRYWPGIRLILTGAVLCDFELVFCRVSYADFGRATFSGPTHFGGTIFSGVAHFSGATFSSTARIDGTIFSGVAHFDEVTFSGDDMPLTQAWVVWLNVGHRWPAGWHLDEQPGGDAVLRPDPPSTDA